jgi:hypothetical protein
VQQGRETGGPKGGATARDRQHGIFNPLKAQAVQQGRETWGATARDRQHGLFNPLKAEAVQQGRGTGGRKASKASKAKAWTKGGRAGKGVKKPQMSAAEGPCTGCGKWGVVGAKHCTWSKEEGRAMACGRYTVSD